MDRLFYTTVWFDSISGQPRIGKAALVLERQGDTYVSSDGSIRLPESGSYLFNAAGEIIGRGETCVDRPDHYVGIAAPTIEATLAFVNGFLAGVAMGRSALFSNLSKTGAN
jgi:hypothetical protein